MEVLIVIVLAFIFYFFLSTRPSYPENDCVVNNKLKYCKKNNCKHLKRKKQNASYNGGIYTPAITNCFCELKSCPYKRGVK